MTDVRQEPFKINMMYPTSQMLGEFILGKLETTEAWVVPMYDDTELLIKDDDQSLPSFITWDFEDRRNLSQVFKRMLKENWVKVKEK